jgi:hypothetical protein
MESMAAGHESGAGNGEKMKKNNRVEVGENLSRLDFEASFPYYKWLRISADGKAPSLPEVEASDAYTLAADVEDFLRRRLNGASQVYSVTWGNRAFGLYIYLSITDEAYWLLGCTEAPDDKQRFFDQLMRLRDKNPAKYRQTADQLITRRPHPATLYY